jgi:DNA-binding CsgD family transcriptional regulator
MDAAAARQPLVDRRNERVRLDALVATVRNGQSGVLVVTGEPGMGKTALLDYLILSAPEFRVVRATGVESEMELPYAALHQLCLPAIDLLPRLPVPQHDALAVALGRETGRPPDRLLVGLGTLTLLCEAANERPLLCLVDDAQWLDRASAHTLAFVARRLLADPIAFVFSTRPPSGELTGLPELVLNGLGIADAQVLLGSVPGLPLDEQVRQRILAETHGNPLALLEWHRGWTAADPGSGPGATADEPLTGQIEDRFRRRVTQLPAATRLFLTIAAAEPVGDPVHVWRAARQLDVDDNAAGPAIEAGLLEIGPRVAFPHPLVRSAAYRSATLLERQSGHRALAESTNPEADPDRRAWHRAQAASGPDEEVASELERSAARAQGRGGLAAAAAFLERSVALTVEPALRLRRTLAAAQTLQQSGRLETASVLLAAAEVGTLEESDRATVELLHGSIGLARGDGSGAVRLKLRAARRLHSIDAPMARDIHLEALAAACFAGRFAPGGDLLEAARAARAAPRPPHPARPSDLLLDGFALLTTEGPAAAASILRLAGIRFRGPDISTEEEIRWLGTACQTANVLWDPESWHVLASRQVELDRDIGALTWLPYALTTLSLVHLFEGALDVAAALIAEAEAINEATGNALAPYSATYLAALRGREPEASTLIKATIKSAAASGQGLALRFAHGAAATLYNGLARYDRALTAAQEAFRHPPDWGYHLMLDELIEASVRSGTPEVAADAFEQLSQTTSASGTNWALGIEARCRALLSDGDMAEHLYREALDRLQQAGMQTEAARAHLLYGEWLRRERRRHEARQHLGVAYEMFTTMGAEGFAERSRIELNATGGTARKRVVETNSDLTAQERQVCRLAAEGGTNAEIAARLFISASTVDYHLRKAFRKLGVGSRTQLAGRVAP